MSYYDNPQWSDLAQNNWEHQGAATPTRTAGASGPQPQDDYAFSYQFDEVDRAYENLQKPGKGYGMGGRHSRASHGPGPRSHGVNSFDDVRGPQGPNLRNFYASQRHQTSRGTSEAEQFMQTKRKMAAQRERELRNRHTEQQYQRNDLVEAPQHGNKHMSEETRELIAPTWTSPASSGPAPPVPAGPRASAAPRLWPLRVPAAPPRSLMPEPPPLPATITTSRPSLAHDRRAPPAPRLQGPPTGPSIMPWVCRVARAPRAPQAHPPPRDLAPGSKPDPSGTTVAPIGTRPSGTSSAAGSGKRATTPLASPACWARGNGVWGQSSGLGAQASVWG